MKERIIGAVVLVMLVVLVVPVFLDGPPADGDVRTERVPLPGQDEEKTQTVVLERNRSEPVPTQVAGPAAGAARDKEVPVPDSGANARTTSGADSAQPAPAPTRPSPDNEANSKETAAPERKAETAPRETMPVAASSSSQRSSQGSSQGSSTSSPQPSSQVSSTGMFAVQLGSFASKENAENLAAALRKQGFAAFLSQLDASGKELHRVRVGPQKDRQAAESMAQRLAQAGHKGQVVPHP